MNWSRRAFGALLSAVVLLAMALPALCGRCQDPAANSDCAQDHGGKKKQPAGPSSGYADCDHCDASPGITANRKMNPGAADLLVFLPDSPRTQLQDSHRIATTFTVSPSNSGHEAFQDYIFVGEGHFPKSGYRPLTVSLKI